MAQHKIYVDLIQTPLLNRLLGRPQRWRWRAINGGNRKVLAVSSESYVNRGDCTDAIHQLFGANSDVYLRDSRTEDVPLRSGWAKA